MAKLSVTSELIHHIDTDRKETCVPNVYQEAENRRGAPFHPSRHVFFTRKEFIS